MNATRRDYFLECMKRGVKKQRREQMGDMDKKFLSLTESLDAQAVSVGYMNWSLLHKAVMSKMTNEEFEIFAESCCVDGKIQYFRPLKK